jgi:hypothetical protein
MASRSGGRRPYRGRVRVVGCGPSCLMTSAAAVDRTDRPRQRCAQAVLDERSRLLLAGGLRDRRRSRWSTELTQEQADMLEHARNARSSYAPPGSGHRTRLPRPGSSKYLLSRSPRPLSSRKRSADVIPHSLKSLNPRSSKNRQVGSRSTLCRRPGLNRYGPTGARPKPSPLRRHNRAHRSRRTI